MSTRFKILALAGAGILLLVFTLSLWAFFLQSDRTKVVFLNVGQGDAILISQGQNQILIDGGRSGQELLSRLGRHIPFWDRRIEVVIPTHPDADHIGGFASLYRAYAIGAILSSGVTSDTQVVEYVEKMRIDYRRPNPQKIIRGTEVRLPSGGELSVLYPLTQPPERVKDTNATSIVTRFVYGETSFLLTGDLPEEERVLPAVEHATILKAAHHGSKFSSSGAFLDLVKPLEAVISVGKNSYGHPAPDVLSRLADRSIVIRRTDEEGDIRYVCSKAEQRCTYAP